jgi:hypothetical protein
VDSLGYIYVAGQTTSTNFPNVNSERTNIVAIGPVAYLTRLQPGGTNIDFSTFLGGTGTDIAYSLAVDSSAGVYLTGLTTSGDLITTNAQFLLTTNVAQYHPVAGNGSVAFITKVKIQFPAALIVTNGTSLVFTWSTASTAHLQESPTGFGGWTDVSPQPVPMTNAANTNQFIVTLPNAAPPAGSTTNVFYRLSFP